MNSSNGNPGNCRRHFLSYQDILPEKSGCWKAAQELEEEYSLPEDTGLYLCVFVPALLEFSDWILKQAVRTGKQRLYFLSRDGWQMYLAAQYLTKQKKLPIECRYLHVSRYCLRIPECYLDLRKGIDRMCMGGIDVTLERILKRGGLTAEEAEKIAGLIGWQERYHEILNYRQIRKLKAVLLRQEKLLEYMEKYSRQAYENTMGYLEQEGLLSDMPYAIVDSGWVGTLQQSLQALVHSRRPDTFVEGYYFGLYELPSEADYAAYHAFYFSPCTGLKRKIYFCNSLFEAVCSAEEGMTLGYIRKENQYVPVLEPAGNPNKVQLRRNQEALQALFTLCDSENIVCVDDDRQLPASGKTKGGGEKAWQQGTCALEKLFTKLMAHPTELEVTAFGNNLFSDDVREASMKRVAERLTEKEIRNQRLLSRLLIMAGIKKETIHESAWIEGSVVKWGLQEKKSRTDINRNLRHIRLYKCFVYGRKQIRSWAVFKIKRNGNKRYAFCWKEGQ